MGNTKNKQSIPELTKREYFSSIILSGMSYKSVEGYELEALVTASVQLSDLLIKELEK